MGFWSIINIVTQHVMGLVTCTHRRANVVEGKTFCPDCGKGIVYRWTVLRCRGCHQRRPLQYFFSDVMPLYYCCTYCGGTETDREYLADPEVFQLTHALLCVSEEKEYNPFFYEVSATLPEFFKDAPRLPAALKTAS